jgi:hypothetical protein
VGKAHGKSLDQLSVPLSASTAKLEPGSGKEGTQVTLGALPTRRVGSVVVKAPTKPRDKDDASVTLRLKGNIIQPAHTFRYAP